ncbi:MAG: PD-(D/E)XK nuclease family protein [Deltaproteobacteria bacterium]|nr:PD-(D/E)XK nuclease family protein [Deltaproteobacteria bacterium]
MKRLIASRRNDVRLGVMSDWLFDTATHQSVLVIGPTRRAADDFARSILRPDEGGRIGVIRLTLRQLARELATRALARAKKSAAGTLAAEALAARSAHLVQIEGRLQIFAAAAKTPGFASALADTLSELRAEGIEPSQLSALGPAGTDLVTLMKAYEAALDAHALADPAEIFDVATTVVEQQGHAFVARPILLLDVAPATRAEERLIRAMSDRSPSVLASALRDDNDGIARLEAALDVHVEYLEDAPLSQAPSRLERAQTRTFATRRNARRTVGAQPDTQPMGSHDDGDAVKDTLAGSLEGSIDSAIDDSLEFFAAGGESAEILEITRRILARARDGIAFDEIAILVRHPAIYEPLIEETLRRAEIPAFFTQGTRRPQTSGRALLALLACAGEHLSARRFAEYLSLGQVPPLDVEAKPKPRVVPWVASKDEIQLVFATALALEPEVPTTSDPGALESAGTLKAPLSWERLLVDAAVVGGRDRWVRRLRGLEEEFLAQIRALEGDDPTRACMKRDELVRLRNLEKFALPIIDVLAAMPKTATWGVWLDQLGALANMALRHPEPVHAVFAELRPMADVGPVALREVREVLTRRLKSERVPAEGQRFGRVFVGHLEEAAGRSFHTVFVPGLTEGLFPEKAFEDPLLLDRARIELAGPEFALRPRRVRRERRMLMLALGAAREKAVVSYPTVDMSQGKGRVPSFYALEILRSAEGRIPSLRVLEHRAQTSASNRPGWPAPRVAAEALDEADYDLSIIGALRDLSPDQIGGRGRYLIEGEGDEGQSPNDCLVRSLRARAQRWRHRFGEADGLWLTDRRSVHGQDQSQGQGQGQRQDQDQGQGQDQSSNNEGPALLPAALATRRPTERPYSATSLQNFAACPYRFLLYAMHGLRRREEFTTVESIDPLTRGSIYHDVQFDLFFALKAEGLLPVTEARLEPARAVLDKVAREVFARYRERLAPAIPQIFAREMRELHQDMNQALHVEAKRSPAWSPIHAELAFGLADELERRDPESRPEPIRVLDRFLVRGSVDLVEAHTESGHLRITDHKTGRLPNPAPRYVGGGQHLQPLLYGLAMEVRLGKPVESGRLSYGTERGQFDAIDVEINDTSRASLAKVLEAIDGAIERGHLPAAPQTGACRYCDFRPVCGTHEEQRVARKDVNELATIEAVRALR